MAKAEAPLATVTVRIRATSLAEAQALRDFVVDSLTDTGIRSDAITAFASVPCEAGDTPTERRFKT